MNSSNSKLLPILLIVLALTGCASNIKKPENSMRLYSPSVLRLKAGQTVQTVDGAYTTQVDEVWHSHADYMARVYESLTK